ncbi:hypothetical protein BDZ94DRAFT_1262388 [Collybia nuda]|uniref:Uncharacterized protein n=1 Tax=Collybia nuda TaxID=64659 RepID=A0A9P5Y443_9AGAR|nr:hypothetical protein BDZ94DRAFT_1262388 [Collybia nuda]
MEGNPVASSDTEPPPRCDEIAPPNEPESSLSFSSLGDVLEKVSLLALLLFIGYDGCFI